MRKYYVGQQMSVYMHISPTNKIYVGSTKLKPAHRWGPGGMSYQYNAAFWEDIQRYGWDNFQHLVVATKLAAEDALQLESDLIHEYQTTNPEFGYNHVTRGGYVGEISPSMRKKLSDLATGYGYTKALPKNLLSANNSSIIKLTAGILEDRLVILSMYTKTA